MTLAAFRCALIKCSRNSMKLVVVVGLVVVCWLCRVSAETEIPASDKPVAEKEDKEKVTEKQFIPFLVELSKRCVQYTGIMAFGDIF